MTSDDGGLGEILNSLERQKESIREQGRLEREQAAARAIAASEERRAALEKSVETLTKIRDASKEFARLARGKNIPTTEIKIFIRQRQGFFFAKDEFTHKRGWVVIAGKNAEHYSENVEDGPVARVRPATAGLYVLSDGTCLAGTPLRITPLITPEQFRINVLSGGWTHPENIPHHGIYPEIIPGELAKYLFAKGVKPPQ